MVPSHGARAGHHGRTRRGCRTLRARVGTGAIGDAGRAMTPTPDPTLSVGITAETFDLVCRCFAGRFVSARQRCARPVGVGIDPSRLY